jgi:hypothetical protein
MSETHLGLEAALLIENSEGDRPGSRILKLLIKSKWARLLHRPTNHCPFRIRAAPVGPPRLP